MNSSVRRITGLESDGSLSCGQSFLIGRAAQIIREKVHAEENTGMAKQIMRDGIWQVSISQRPKNWQSMGGREA